MLISYLVVKRIFLFSAVGGGVAVLTVFLLFSVFAVATQNYAMNVDPIKDNQYLFRYRKSYDYKYGQTSFDKYCSQLWWQSG